jgi:hypothetical protein
MRTYSQKHCANNKVRFRERMACHSLLLHWQIQTFISNKAFTLAAGTWVLTGTGYVYSKSIGRCAVGDGGLHFFCTVQARKWFYRGSSSTAKYSTKHGKERKVCAPPAMAMPS